MNFPFCRETLEKRIQEPLNIAVERAMRIATNLFIIYFGSIHGAMFQNIIIIKSQLFHNTKKQTISLYRKEFV